MGEAAPALPAVPAPAAPPLPDAGAMAEAARLAAAASSPVILAGGGARHAGTELQRLAEMLAAPVVLTANGRGLLFGHRLGVPASPSLKAVRRLIDAADLVIAAGTEMGPTDYDMYGDGGFVHAGETGPHRHRCPSARPAAGDRVDPGRLQGGARRRWLPASPTGPAAARHATARRGRPAPAPPLATRSARRCGHSSRLSRRSAIRCPARSSSATPRSPSMPPISTMTTTGRAAGSTRPPASARWATACRRRSARRSRRHPARRSSASPATAASSSPFPNSPLPSMPERR